MSALIEYPDLAQGSDAWHDLRRGMVTASVVGQLISVGYLGAEAFGCPDCDAEPNQPCRSKVKRAGEYGAIKTFHQARADIAASSRGDEHLVIEPARNSDVARRMTMLLTAERITGFTEPTYVSDDMWRGMTDEPIARDLYSQHFAQVHEYGFMVLERDGWKLGFSPDGLVGDDGAIEIKSRRSNNQLKTILTDTVPAENMAQIQTGLLVSGRKWLDYVSYCGGMPLYVKRVYPDPRWFNAIVRAVDAFEHVAAEMTARYTEATVGMPATERVVEQEMTL
jgi:hypothetical protein